MFTELHGAVFKIDYILVHKVLQIIKYKIFLSYQSIIKIYKSLTKEIIKSKLARKLNNAILN